jgi:hypothetical protein
MAHQESMMTTKEDLVERIENILKTDLDFLLKLAPRELGILATALKGLVDREKKYILRDYRQKSIDL